VFELSPPASIGGNWTESILWSFGNGTDGSSPDAGVIMDGNGNLFGTTSGGGTRGSGTVFELTPPSAPGGPWTESILWSFGSGGDGAAPEADLIMDSGGNLFSTTAVGGTYGVGTAFELSPPSTSGGNWTESVLWNFGNSGDGKYLNSGLLRDESGNLYGTTGAGGTYNLGIAFELTPSGGTWNETILRSFGGNGTDGSFNCDNQSSGLIMDPTGNLYGTTCGGGTNSTGTVFELSPPAGSGGNWTESILYSFGNPLDGNSPEGGVIMDIGGNLYGTTTNGGAFSGDGTAFELKPPSIGGGKWTESILWNFNDVMGSDGQHPVAALVMDTASNLYGTTSGNGGGNGGGAYGQGTVFEINPTASGSPTPTPTPTPSPTTLTASPAQLSFGNVVATETSTAKKVTLTNKGAAPAQILGVGATPPFTTTGADTCSGHTVMPKKTCSIEVEFTPTTVGEENGGFVFAAYNGANPLNPLVTLKGNSIGVTLKAPKSASFPPVSAGNTGSAKNLVISNPSTVMVTFGTAALSGTDPGSFKFAGDYCSGQPLAPKGKCGIGVEFAPPGNASGSQSATLSISFTYGANQGNVAASLSGKVK
jgi:uncharacterized repeat protein (TIGR03803 family)